MELIEGDHELNPENRNKNFSFHSFIIFITHGVTSSRSKLVNILLVFHSATDWSTRVLRLYCMQQQGLEFITMRQNKNISQYSVGTPGSLPDGLHQGGVPPGSLLVAAPGRRLVAVEGEPAVPLVTQRVQLQLEAAPEHLLHHLRVESSG